MQTTQLLTTTFETTSPLTETQTAPLENVVESMGEEVHHASRVLNAVLTPNKSANPSLIMAIIIEGKRRLIKMSVDDILNIVREYQLITRGTCCYEHTRELLERAEFFVPEDV